MDRSGAQVKEVARHYGINTVIFCTLCASVFGVAYVGWYDGGFNNVRHIIIEALLSAGVGTSVGLIAVMLNLKRFFRPIGIMVNFVANIGERDLSQNLQEITFEFMDFMRVALDRMGRSMMQLVFMVAYSAGTIDQSSIKLKEQTQRISGTAAEMASAIGEVSRASTDQVESVQGIVSETSRVGELIKQIALNTRQVSSSLNDMQEAAYASSSAVEEQKSRMEANRQVIEKVSIAITRLDTTSHQISNVMSLITEIAGQTNLLALNASIEAARSGEQGHGFQVVSQEVRKLAEQSTEAAKEIGAIISEIEKSIDNVSSETEIAQAAVRDQERAILDNQNVINQVVENVARIGEEMNLVLTGIDDIGLAVQTIDNRIDNIAEVTQQSTLAVGSVLSDTAEQNKLMNSLDEIVNKLREEVKQLQTQTEMFKLPQEMQKEDSRDQDRVQYSLEDVARRYQIRTVILTTLLSGIGFGSLLPFGIDAGNWRGILEGMTCAGAGGLVIGLMSTSLNVKKFIKPAGYLVEKANIVAGGDLTVAIPADQDMGKLDIVRDVFNKMVVDLRTVSVGILNSSNSVNISAGAGVEAADKTLKKAKVVAQTIDDLTHGATRQAADMAETSENVMEITRAVEKISSITVDIADYTANTKQMVGDGLASANYQRRKVEENVLAINRMTEAAYDLEQKSMTIGQIVKVITDIAGETNLLALNAAIEAARAGDQGRGFAVVADEVRKLAEETSKAALGIYDLIEEIKTGTTEVVANMQDAREALENQVKAVLQNEQLLDQMNQHVLPVNNGAREVADAATTIRNAVETIAGQVQNIAAASEETAAASEEVLASTEEQERLLENTKNEIEAFAQLTRRLYKMTTALKVEKTA
ncbi:MAG: methyl-accepting chemotaxis protein [Candidatus Saccharibacteria bacterium]